jgi:hypothetical protein
LAKSEASSASGLELQPELKKLVEEGSNGEIAVKIFPSQLLGTGLQMSEMVQAGALEILAIPTSNMQVLHPSLQVLDLPFLFPEETQTPEEVLEGAALEEVISKSFPWLHGDRFFCGYIDNSRLDLFGHLNKGLAKGLGSCQPVIFWQRIGPMAIHTKEEARKENKEGKP